MSLTLATEKPERPFRLAPYVMAGACGLFQIEAILSFALGQDALAALMFLVAFGMLAMAWLFRWIDAKIYALECWALRGMK